MNKGGNMKQKLLVALMIVGLAIPAWSQSDPQSVFLTVNVPQIFHMDVTQNAGSVSFGDMGPGLSVFKTIGLSIFTNKGTPWAIALNADPITRGGGTEQLPASAFQYSISGGGVGVYTPASGLANVPVSPATIYTSGGGETIVNGLEFGLGVQLNMPVSAQAGSYSTSLHITLMDLI